jgi:hypothetical protein
MVFWLVSPDELHTVDTSSTPSFLGLDAPGGFGSNSVAWEVLAKMS